MMTESHYDEELLLSLADAGEEELSRDPHLRACPSCSQTLTAVRGVADCLKAQDVWDATEISETPNANVLSFLVGAQNAMRSDDATADSLVRDLLAQPRETWLPTLHAHPEWRTPGMVRKLIEATDRAIETMPPDALEITAMAVEIADGLNDARLRGHAWRERAYALYFTGAYTEALAAVERSRAAFAECVNAEFDDARAGVVFALICASQERFAEALAAARAAAEVFLRHESRGKYVAARRTEAIILYTLRRCREALDIYHSLEPEALSHRDRIGLWQNIAACYREYGDLDSAQRYFTLAIEAGAKLGMLTYMGKTRWQLGLVLLGQGRAPEALHVLRDVRDEFLASNMAHDIAEITTDIAHALVLSGQMSAVGAECREALRYFADAGLSMTEPAMAAIGLLREAAAAGRLNERAVAQIRTTVVNSRPPERRLYLD